ncbi:hypothetical protein CR513_18518, partial [Mucuna pruriens]
MTLFPRSLLKKPSPLNLQNKGKSEGDEREEDFPRTFIGDLIREGARAKVAKKGGGKEDYWVAWDKVSILDSPKTRYSLFIIALQQGVLVVC